MSPRWKDELRAFNGTGRSPLYSIGRREAEIAGKGPVFCSGLSVTNKGDDDDQKTPCTTPTNYNGKLIGYVAIAKLCLN